MAKRKREKPVLESVIEDYLRNQLMLAGGWCPKWSSPGNNGVPDRICFLNGNVVFVELKRPGGKPRADQVDVHKRMALRGVGVLVIDSKKQVDELIVMMKAKEGHGGW